MPRRALTPAVLAAATLALALVAPPAWAAPTLSRIKALEALVAEDCGACHGLSRRGGLGSPLTAEALDGKADDALAATILDGRPGTAMPPWRGLLDESDAGWIVRHLKEGQHGP